MHMHAVIFKFSVTNAIIFYYSLVTKNKNTLTQTYEKRFFGIVFYDCMNFAGGENNVGGAGINMLSDGLRTVDR